MADDAVDKIVIQIVAEGGDEAKSAMDGAGKGAEVLGREVDRLNKRIDELTSKMREAIRANNDFNRELGGDSGGSRGTSSGNAKSEIERQYNLLQEARRQDALNKQRSREGNKDFGDQQRAAASLNRQRDRSYSQQFTDEHNEKQRASESLNSQRNRAYNQQFTDEYNEKKRASESLRNQRDAAYNKQASDEYKNSPQAAQEARQQQWQSHFQRFRVGGASEQDATMGANQVMAEHAKAAAKELKELGRNAAATSPAMKAMREGMRLISEGGVRRGFSHMISHGLGGEEPGVAASIAGGFGGTLASSLFMPIAWGIGNMLAELPGALMKAQEGRVRFEAGASHPLSPELESKANARMNYWEAQGAGGRDAFRHGAEYLQEAGFSDEDVIKYQDALMYLGQGAAGRKGGSSEQFANIKRLKTSEEKWSFIKGSAPLQDYMMANYVSNDVPDQDREANLQRQVMRGDFNSRNFPEIVLRAVETNRKLKRRTDSTANTWSGEIRGAFDAIVNGSGHHHNRYDMPGSNQEFRDDPWNDPEGDPGNLGGLWFEKDENGEYRGYSREEMQKKHAHAPPPPPTNTMTRNRGNELFDPNAPQKGPPERMGYDYSFHSATGLAEDMQRMWSGPGQDWQESTANNTKDLVDLLKSGTAIVQVGHGAAIPEQKAGTR